MKQRRWLAIAAVAAFWLLVDGRISGQGGPPYGLTIPAGDFMLYFTPQRLADARQWYAANSGAWSPRSSPAEEAAADSAFLYLMNGNTAAAQSAINWAANYSFYTTNAGDEARWAGEYQILVFSWLKNLFTPAQRQATIASINRAIANDLTKTWGGPASPANNYNWGFTRNALLWSIASYNENYTDPATGRTQRQIANDFLTNSLITRWLTVTAPFHNSVGRGGTMTEGSHYGPYFLKYFSVPLVQTRLFGRPLTADTNIFREAVYGTIYATTPKPTYGSPRHNIAPRIQVFSYGDEQDSDGFPPAASSGYGGDTLGSFMVMAAADWSSTVVGRHARHWVNTVRPIAEPWFPSTDTGRGQAGLQYSSLPLDFYSAGPGFLYTRDTWGNSSADKPTIMLFQLKQPKGSHAHCDAGSFQILRNDRWVMRESPGRSLTYAGPAGGTVSGNTIWAHNGLTVNNSDVGEYCGDESRPDPIVLRLESRPTHAYAAVDLSGYHAIAGAPVIIREFVHVRDLHTMVAFDRVRSTQDVPKTAIVHFQTNPARSGNVTMGTSGNEQLRLTTLTSNVAGQTTTFTVVDEASAGSGSGGTWEPQYRLQINTRGTLDSYHINVFQARSVGDPDVTATLGETSSAFTVTLARPGQQTVILTFNKGVTSSGGGIQIGSTPAPFTSSVMESVVTDNGVSWGNEGSGGGPPRVPSGFRILP